MAYQKLQASAALKVAPSDTVDIPSVAAGAAGGTATATTANKLVMATGDFLSSVRVGFIVVNTTDNTTAYVTAVDSDTTLSLSVDIMANTETFVIYGEGTNNGCTLYVGDITAGATLTVITAAGNEVQFTGLLAGQFIPLQVTRVKVTGTLVTGIIAMW